jgi:DNA repair protein RadB
MMVERVSTGCKLLDDLLRGGYEKEIITTIYGPSASGKTNLCIVCAASVAKKAKVVWIDTDGSFSVERFLQVAKDKKLLDNLVYLRCTTFAEQAEAVQKATEMAGVVGLLVIDNITTLYRAERVEEDNRELNAAMRKQLRDIIGAAHKKKIPVISTAQVYADLENKDKVQVVGGLLIRNMSKCLIELQKQNSIRRAIIRKHRSVPEGKEVSFKIVESGIRAV